jgi:uncharacterized protein (DUF58 family)
MSVRSGIGALWRSATRWLTLGGRLRLAQPWAVVVGAVALALGVAFPSRWLLFLVYAYLLLLLFCYLWVRLVGPQLRLSRHLTTAWAQVGDELEERWSLVNGAPLPLPWLEIDDDSTLPSYNARRVAGCAAGEKQRWRTAARCERRGVYRLGPLTARLSDAFGLFSFEWRERAQRQLIVYPPLVRLPPLPLPRGRRGGLAQADLLQRFATPSVGGLRDYTPGDPLSRIHWPYVARYDRLVVKEFDQERAGALWLVLDLAASAYPADESRGEAAPEPESYAQSSVVSARPAEIQSASLVELAVTLAASLAAQALAEGRAVGLLCDDGRRRIVAPAGGSGQLWQILNELVDGGATGRQSLGELLRESRAFRGQRLAGAGLVVITGALDGAWLPALADHGLQAGALALLVAHRGEAAAPCAAALAAQGVASRTFTLGTALPLLNPPRQSVTARVSPLGRVIRTADEGGR